TAPAPARTPRRAASFHTGRVREPSASDIHGSVTVAQLGPRRKTGTAPARGRLPLRSRRPVGALLRRSPTRREDPRPGCAVWSPASPLPWKGRPLMTTDTTPTFTDLGVPAVIADALTRDGITAPFPIQTDTLPDTLAGKDVLGRGKTGSGKTLAFSIPLATRLADGTRSAPRRPRGLVLAPTRELATQIAKTLTPLAK